MLRDFLEGKVFTVGQTIQCSWMWFKVGTDEHGKSEVLAPTLGVMPMDFAPDCSDALNLVLTQRYVCDSFGVECSWCNAAQSAIVVKDIAACGEVFMNRTEDQHGNISGWFFGASDSKLDVNDPENLELKSLWQLSCEHPESRDFFLLPAEWQVAFEERPVVLRNTNLATARPDSYYAAKYQS
jgi:hypothetical protein